MQIPQAALDLLPVLYAPLPTSMRPYASVGADATTPVVVSPAISALAMVGWAGSMAGGISGAYHGYKRNDSVGWAIGWGLLGSAFWPITIPISLAQGFGQRKAG